MAKLAMGPSEEAILRLKGLSVTRRPVYLIKIERAMPTPFKFLTRA